MILKKESERGLKITHIPRDLQEVGRNEQFELTFLLYPQRTLHLGKALQPDLMELQDLAVSSFLLQERDDFLQGRNLFKSQFNAR